MERNESEKEKGEKKIPRNKVKFAFSIQLINTLKTQVVFNSIDFCSLFVSCKNR